MADVDVKTVGSYWFQRRPTVAETVITVKASVELPRVPNFLRMTDEKWLPICALEEESLRALGAAWTDNLIVRAAEQKAEMEKSNG
jgi:hypothetical protein